VANKGENKCKTSSLYGVPKMMGITLPAITYIFVVKSF